jgi:hypothetical protein
MTVGSSIVWRDCRIKRDKIKSGRARKRAMAIEATRETERAKADASRGIVGSPSLRAQRIHSSFAAQMDCFAALAMTCGSLASRQ